MTNKEKYKRAFSALHASGEFKEVTAMKTSRHIRMKRVAVLCAAVIFVLAMASVAYAADVGGIQREIQIWIKGDQTDAVMEITDGNYTITYEEADGTQRILQGGGVSVDGFGNVSPMGEQDVLDFLDMPDVKFNEDGTVWVYYHDQALDITDSFDEDGVCHVMLKDGGKTLYVTVNSDGSFSVSDSAYHN